MLGQILPVENAVRIVLLRLMSKDQDDFVFHLEAGVVIVMIIRCGDSISSENDGPACFPICTQVERNEVRSLFQSTRPSVFLDCQSVAVT